MPRMILVQLLWTVVLLVPYVLLRKRFLYVTAASLLFDPLSTALSEKEKNKVVFLHLMGCHTEYRKRYPHDFEQFKGAKDKQGKTVDAYDNAVYYNDFVIDSMFSLLRDYSQLHPDVRISALYFSDHGENVYDEGDYCGHNYSDRIPHANVEIPFIL